MNTPNPKPAPPAENPMPPNMPHGWEAMRNAFPPEIRDPFEDAYSRAFPGDPSKWKDDIAWNYFQVLRLQTAMQAYVNVATEQQVIVLRALRKEIREALIAFTQSRAANNEASLHLHQAAQIIRDAEVIRKEYEVVRQEVATPWKYLLMGALLWTALTLGGQYCIITTGTAAGIKAGIYDVVTQPDSQPRPPSGPISN